MNRSIKYYSGFHNPTLSYRLSAGAFQKVTMIRVGPGRTEGEWLWQATFEAPFEAVVQFFIEGQNGRDPSRRYYESGWAHTYVCDGGVFDYLPTTVGAKIAPSEKAYSVYELPSYFSPTLQRDITYRTYLPRGYRQNAARRYPVLYMLDGQNVFENSGFGTWRAKESLDRLIRRGQIAEIIVVAIDSGSTRYQDYVPPEDGGQADKFAKFLATEFKPHIDNTLRTKPDRDNTGLLGSSLGGVMSLYAGWNYFHKFGRVGSMSGSWWLQNFRESLRSQRKRPLKVYLDSGDSGYASDCVQHTSLVRSILENVGFELGFDLHHGIGRLHEHNEMAWSKRLPFALKFLFPAA